MITRIMPTVRMAFGGDLHRMRVVAITMPTRGCTSTAMNNVRLLLHSR
ncbi:hypothetical protein ISS40_10855 [Candidatus Bathyarchaeota archaeon]|nr:hypothetical protein [Candidatus Bathyarchaeota archaeon]